MSRPNPVTLMLFLAAALAVLGGMTVWKDALYLAKHEGDTLHLLDILSRMAAGERIHQDFMTPIGILAFAPIALFVRAGEGFGHALIWGQILVALILLPAIWWTIWTRLSGFAAYLVGLYLIALATALTYGESEASVSMSMHYNRWAWVMAYLAILLALLPARVRRNESVDGLLIGTAMAALALIKVTYFAAFVIPVALSLLMKPATRTLVTAAAAGLVVAVLVTFWQGTDFWVGYLADLRTVSASEMRPAPGQPLGNILGSPAFLGVSLTALFSVVILRQAREARAGLILLLLFPGFAYVTYQNYGNDPQWLILLAAVLLSLRPEPELKNGWGWHMATMFNGTAIAALAFAAPSFFNLAYSPYRHMALKAADYTPILPRSELHHDLLTATNRATTLNGQIALDEPGSGLEEFREMAKREDIATLNGETLRVCELMSGLVAWYNTVAADLETAGYAGKGIFEADLLNALPLYGDFRPIAGGAPWYYGGAPGIEDADYVLVADCPLAGNARKMKLDAIEAAGIGLREIRRTTLYRLYEKTAPGTDAAAPDG